VSQQFSNIHCVFPPACHVLLRSWLGLDRKDTRFAGVSPSRWYSLGENRWYTVGENVWYTVGENTWYTIGENRWYSITRKLTPRDHHRGAADQRAGTGDRGHLRRGLRQRNQRLVLGRVAVLATCPGRKHSAAQSPARQSEQACRVGLHRENQADWLTNLVRTRMPRISRIMKPR
jgi:hypothetical protein